MRTRKKIARNQSANQGPAQSYLSQFEGSPTKKDGQQLIADENSKSLLIENYNLSRANFPGNSGPQQPHLANLQGSHRISQLTKTANTKRFFYLFEKGNSVFDFDIYFHEFSKFSCLEEILPEIDIKKSKLIKFLFTGYSMGSQFQIARKERDHTTLLVVANNDLSIHYFDQEESLMLFDNKRLEAILKKNLWGTVLDVNFQKDLIYNSYYENLQVVVNLRQEFGIYQDDLIYKDGFKLFSLINHMTLLQLDGKENNIAFGGKDPAKLQNLLTKTGKYSSKCNLDNNNTTFEDQRKDGQFNHNEDINFSIPYTSKSSQAFVQKQKLERELVENVIKRDNTKQDFPSQQNQNTVLTMEGAVQLTISESQQSKSEMKIDEPGLDQQPQNTGDCSLRSVSYQPTGNNRFNTNKPKLSKITIIQNQLQLNSRRKFIINNQWGIENGGLFNFESQSNKKYQKYKQIDTIIICAQRTLTQGQRQLSP